RVVMPRFRPAWIAAIVVLRSPATPSTSRPRCRHALPPHPPPFAAAWTGSGQPVRLCAPRTSTVVLAWRGRRQPGLGVSEGGVSGGSPGGVDTVEREEL